MIMENKEHRDKVRQLEAQLDKLKGESRLFRVLKGGFHLCHCCERPKEDLLC